VTISRIDLEGFAPDLDPNNPAILVDCDRVYPTTKGVRPQPALVQSYPAPATGPVRGAHVATYLDGTSRLYVGTESKLYRGLNGAYQDYSGGQTFQTPENLRWRFAQFGDDTIAVNGFDLPQFINSTGGSFAPLAGNPPIARFVAVANNFVFLLGLHDPDGLAALTPTQWWCSAIGNDADWSPSASTQSANAYLDDTPGEIVGAKALGRDLIVYKTHSIYKLSYAGPPVIWESVLISAHTGALSQEAVVDMGDFHVIMGQDDFYIVDASGAQPLKSPLRRYIYEFGDLNRAYSFGAAARHDDAADCVIFHYPSSRLTEQTDPVTLDANVVWNVHEDKWAKGMVDIIQVVTPEIPVDLGQTYGEFGTPFATWDGIVTVQWNDYVFFGSTNVIQGVILPDGSLWAYSGEADPDAFIECGDFGDGQQFQFIRKVRARFSDFPSSAGATLVLKHRRSLGEPVTLGKTVYLDQVKGAFNFRANAMFTRHRFEFGGGDCELIGYDIDHLPMGTR
jgi:hypothetical protein